jgi:hypothetical protein
MILTGILITGVAITTIGIIDCMHKRKMKEFIRFIKSLYIKDDISDEDHHKLWSMKQICKDYKITTIELLDLDMKVIHYYTTQCCNFEDDYHYCRQMYTYSLYNGRRVKFLLLENTYSDTMTHHVEQTYQRNKHIFATLLHDSGTCYYLIVPI